MKNQFKMVLLMLIISAISNAQRHQILKKSEEVSNDASVILNFENVYVAIEESTDGKMHIDYLMEFEGFSKKEIQKKLDQVTANLTHSDQHITLNVKSEQQITFASYELKGDHGLYIEGDFLGTKNDSVIRKSKDSLLKEIIENNVILSFELPFEFSF